MPSNAPAIFAASLMAAAGLTAATMILIDARSAPKPDETLPAAVTQIPSVPLPVSGASAPDASFAFHQNEILNAATPVRKIQTALAMVDFILRAQDWRSERDRMTMAREYVMAVAELQPAGAQRLRTSRHLFDLALELRDREMLDRGEALLRGDPPLEAIPFGLLCAEVDALIAVGDPALIYVRLNELAERSAVPSEEWRYRLRATRGIARAVFDSAARAALLAHREAEPETLTLDMLIAELQAEAAALSQCGIPDVESEGLWHLATLKELLGDKDAEIELLQQAVAKGGFPDRERMHIRLAGLLRETGRDAEHAALLSRMMGRFDLRRLALILLEERLQDPAEKDVAFELLQSVNQYVELASALEPPAPGLLLAAARTAIGYGWMNHANRYLDQAETMSLDRNLLADIMMLRADIAGLEGDRATMMRNMIEVIGLHPGHPREGDIRFQLLKEMAERPFSEADLVGGVMGAIVRLPRDPRGIDGLMLVAQRMEAMELHELAESYYRRVVLLSSLLPARQVGSKTAEALLGQARTLIAQGKEAEADALLRVINTNSRWSDLWRESGPLWAMVAFRQGQPREGIRRWRQTSGPPGGDLLLFVFRILVPDLAEMTTRIEGAGRRRPAPAPPELVETAVTAAFDHLLADGDYTGVERLIQLAAADTDFGSRLPVRSYHIRYLAHLVAAREPVERITAWLDISPGQRAVPANDDMSEWVEAVEDITRRARSLRL